MRLDSYTVPNMDLEVRVNMPIASESLGGQTSATDTAHKGFKPKLITVSLILPFKLADELSELVRIAEAVDDKGDKKVYLITDMTANAMKIRQVKFDEGFNVRRKKKVQAWEINFVLAEHLSVPEKAEQKISTSASAGQSSEGETVQSSADRAEAITEKRLSYLEGIMRVADTWIGPAEDKEEEGEADS